MFQRITKIRTRFCFSYNNVLIFCVPRIMVTRAIGKDAQNVRQINRIVKKRIKVIAQPEGISDLEKFVSAIVSPIEFKSIEVKGGEVVLTAGPESKAALIGRDKRRLLEMQRIIKDFFGKDFRII